MLVLFGFGSFTLIEKEKKMKYKYVMLKQTENNIVFDYLFLVFGNK